MRSQELSLCLLEEIKKELKPQGITDVKRVSIKRDNKIIHTNMYIMTFELPVILPKIKIGYTMERVEQFIPNPLGAINVRNTGITKINVTERVCGKCEQKDPDHYRRMQKHTQMCKLVETTRYMQKHVKNGKEKEILSIKYTRNISFLEAQKIVDATSRDKTSSQA